MRCIMKKFFAVLLSVLTIFLCACGTGSPEVPVSSPVPAVETEESVPEPKIMEAEVIGVEAPAVLAYLDRGDEIGLMGECQENGNYYIVKSAKGFGLVSKNFVRLADEADYESWTGQAADGAKLYSDYYRTDDSPVKLEKGTELKVIDAIDDAYVVEYDSKVGIVPMDKVSGGNTVSTGSTSSENSTLPEHSSVVVEQKESEITGKAVIRADHTPLLGALFSRGEQVSVKSHDEETAKLCILDFEAETEMRYLRFAEDAEYESWICFAEVDTEVYSNPYLVGEISMTPDVNTQCTVLADMGNCYFVKVDERLGYMDKVYACEDEIDLAVQYPDGNYGASRSDEKLPSSGWTVAIK